MNRPFITLPQLICEIIAGVLCLIGLLVGLIAGITITEPIPTHFSITGEIDGYGSAYVAIIMPAAMLGLNIMMCIIAHFSNPAKWNLPFKLNEKNALPVYHDLVWTYVLIELELSIFALLFSILVLTDRKLLMPASIFMVMCIVPSSVVPSVIASKHNKM